MKSKKALARRKAEEEAAAKVAKANRYKSLYGGTVEDGNLTADDLRLPADDALVERLFSAGSRVGRNSTLQVLNLLNRLDDITCATSQISARMQEASQRLGLVGSIIARGDPHQLSPFGTVTGRASSPHPVHISQGGPITPREWARAVAATSRALDGMSSILPAHHDFITLHSPIEGDDE